MAVTFSNEIFTVNTRSQDWYIKQWKLSGLIHLSMPQVWYIYPCLNAKSPVWYTDQHRTSGLLYWPTTDLLTNTRFQTWHIDKPLISGLLYWSTSYWGTSNLRFGATPDLGPGILGNTWSQGWCFGHHQILCMAYWKFLHLRSCIATNSFYWPKVCYVDEY